MKLTNSQIYNYAVSLGDFVMDNSQKLPVKINFYFQKNKNTLVELAKGIEEARLDIIRNYNENNDDSESCSIPEEKIVLAQKELLDLLNLEQEVQIYTVNINDFPRDLNLTTSQMEALMFMIEE